MKRDGVTTNLRSIINLEAMRQLLGNVRKLDEYLCKLCYVIPVDVGLRDLLWIWSAVRLRSYIVAGHSWRQPKVM